MVEKIVDYFGAVKGKKLALWGLAFKPDTDDIREASALYMIEALTELGAEIVAFDPEASDNVRGVVGDKISYASNQYDALNGCDALMIATEWGLFRNPDFDQLKERLNEPIIFDGRNLFDLSRMEENGILLQFNWTSHSNSEIQLDGKSKTNINHRSSRIFRLASV